MRYASIDALRTVAIVLMVVVHFMENLAGAEWTPGGFGAPLFTFLVGVNYRLWADSREAKGRPGGEIMKVSVRRGLFLFALGFAFNVLVWLPEDTFNWDVLTLIGTSLVLLAFVRRLPLAVLLVAAALAFALAPALRAATDYPAFWTNGYFEYDLTPGDVLAGFVATGYFPLFPWVGYPLAGFMAGSLLFPKEPGRRPPTGRGALVGAVLVCLALAALMARHFAPGRTASLAGGWTMFPPSAEYVVGTLGLCLLLLSLGRRWVDPNARVLERAGVLVVITTFSKYSLTIYVLHHVLHLWPLWVAGAAAGHEPTHFWRNAMPVTAAVPLSVLCLAVCFAAFRWMDWRRWPGIESWMRYLCD